MKIMQVNVTYKKGSTGKIIYDIHRNLQKEGYDSIICYGRGEKYDEPNVSKISSELYAKINNVISRFTGIIYGGCYFSTYKLISKIKKEKPDVVHLHCLNGNFINIYNLLKWVKKNKIKTVLTLHAEFMYTGGCGYAINCEEWKNDIQICCNKCNRCYKISKSIFFNRTHAMWKKMKESLYAFENLVVVGVSNWISNQAAMSKILENYKIMTIHNGVDLHNFIPYTNEHDERIYVKYNLPRNKKLIVHITPAFSNPEKGGKYFIKLAEYLNEDYQCVIVGCKEKVNSKIITIPFVQDQQELAALYRQSSVMVLTSILDNYPTVCIEANCCGTPVVGFDVGGVNEAIGYGMGTVVNSFDIKELTTQVINWSEKKGNINKSYIKERRNYCDSSRMTNDYISLYESIVENKSNLNTVK